MKNPTSLAAAAAAFGLTLAPGANAQVFVSQDFDGGGLNSAYALTESGDAGTGAIVTNTGGGAGGARGNVLRLVNNTNSNNNSIAFDAITVPAGTPRLSLSVDFWLGPDGSASGSGTAADGFGIGYFPTAAYGTSGASNPAAIAPGFAWERPNPGAGVFSLTMGVDIYPGTSATDGNHVNLWWNGAELGNVDPGFVLNSGQWHRLTLTAIDQGSDSRLLVDIVQDVDGAAISSNLIDVVGTGVDLDGIGSNYRLIGGGRTGGENHVGQWDTISVVVPEPSVLAIGALGAAMLGFRRRRL
jgi:hypothetical protein